MNRLSSGVLGLVIGGALGLGVTGCGGDDDAAPATTQTASEIEVKGTWTGDSFGETETDIIDDHSWSSQFGDSDPSVSTIVEYSNDDRTAVVQLPADDKYNPSKYSEILWTAVADGSFYYCTASFGCSSADQAKNGPADSACTLSTVDATDLDGAGCGGSPWTKLSAE